MARILVIGPPRCGTTWIGQTLGRANGARYVHEPDGFHEPFALKATIGHPAYIELAADQPADTYETLWRAAFGGGRRGTTLRDRAAKRLFDESARNERSAARRRERTSVRLRAALALARPLQP